MLTISLVISLPTILLIWSLKWMTYSPFISRTPMGRRSKIPIHCLLVWSIWKYIENSESLSFWASRLNLMAKRLRKMADTQDWEWSPGCMKTSRQKRPKVAKFRIRQSILVNTRNTFMYIKLKDSAANWIIWRNRMSLLICTCYGSSSESKSPRKMNMVCE